MLSKSSIGHERYFFQDLMLLFLALLCFYTCWLGSYPLFTPDEGRYSEIAREMLVTQDFITPKLNGIVFLDKPILHYWLQAFAIYLFGLKEWSLRLFPALFGILGCLVTYCAGRYFYDRRTALLSAFILASSPLYFIGAHYANLDLEVAVLISCSLFFFLSGLVAKQNTFGFIIIAYIFSALAFLTKGLIAIAFPFMIIGLWCSLLRKKAALKKLYIIPGLGIFSLIVLPWYVLVQRTNPEFLHYFFITQHIVRFLSLAKFNNQMPFWFYIPVLVTGLFPWLIFALPAAKKYLYLLLKYRNKYQVELFLFLWVVCVLAFFSIPHAKIVTYVLPLFPACALLIGRYLAIIWDNCNASIVHYLFVQGIACAGILFFIKYYYALMNIGDFNFYFFIILIIVLTVACLHLFLAKQKNLQMIFMSNVIGNILCLISLTLGAAHLNKYSIKPLALHLKTIIKPNDVVISYFKYYQDLPLYLERFITIVNDWDSSTIMASDNWARELSLGKNFQNSKINLISENIFWQAWTSKNRIYLLLNDNYFDEFKKNAKPYYYVFHFKNTILLSNKPIIA